MESRALSFKLTDFLHGRKTRDSSSEDNKFHGQVLSYSTKNVSANKNFIPDQHKINVTANMLAAGYSGTCLRSQGLEARAGTPL